jgi:Leucine-rich repeat (LRR) protein
MPRRARSKQIYAGSPGECLSRVEQKITMKGWDLGIGKMKANGFELSISELNPKIGVCTPLRLNGPVALECIGDISAIKGEVKLDYSNMQIKSLPTAFTKCTQLRFLHLNGNQLTYLPDALGDLAKLEFLSLEHNRLTKLPDSIAQLSMLKILMCNSNRLSKFPKAVCKLTQLQSLEMANNELDHIPSAIGRLVSLERLFLWRNSLVKLPSALGDLSNLQTLNVSQNRIIKLPETMAKLTNLRTFNCSMQRHWLGEPLDEFIAPIDDPNWEYMLFDFTAVCDLAGSLRSLDMSFCGLQKLPADFVRLRSKLDHLNLSDNSRWLDKYMQQDASALCAAAATAIAATALFEASLVVGEAIFATESLVQKQHPLRKIKEGLQLHQVEYKDSSAKKDLAAQLAQAVLTQGSEGKRWPWPWQHQQAGAEEEQ